MDAWLASARRGADPVGDMAQKRADLEGWGKGVDPERRVDILAAYAVQEQLSEIEAELSLLEENAGAGHAQLPSVAARLAELRRALPALGASARRLGIGSIVRQYDRIEAVVERLSGVVAP